MAAIEFARLVADAMSDARLRASEQPSPGPTLAHTIPFKPSLAATQLALVAARLGANRAPLP